MSMIVFVLLLRIFGLGSHSFLPMQPRGLRSGLETENIAEEPSKIRLTLKQSSCQT